MAQYPSNFSTLPPGDSIALDWPYALEKNAGQGRRGKNRVDATDVEAVLREDDFIVSKTDLKGRITYCNRIFVEYSGYSEEELLGSPHNIIRHPDMPKAVFKLMWEQIAAGNEFLGYVRNMAKNGSFYWTFANVTPSLDKDKNPLGYFSVRRKPDRQKIALVEPIYRRMLAEEAGGNGRAALAKSAGILTEAQGGLDYHEFILSL